MKIRTAKILLLLLFVAFLPTRDAAASLGELRLSMIEGDVQIKTADGSEWVPAAINFPLRDGDQLWVPQDGRAEVEARRGTIVRLDAMTSLDILTVDNDALQFYLSMGLVYVNAKGERGTTLQMDTPVSSIRVYERAKFGAEVADRGDTDISVFLGSVSAETRRGATRVEAGNMLSLGENSADLSPLGLADAWEQWNKDQDRSLEERRESVRYLPEELNGYASDFDNNGEWVDMPSYGHVWRPVRHITPDWSPYRHGRWVWVGGDYVWIAYEPWGWAPYHYGRWDFLPRYGWCWVPPVRHEVYWGPGYVGWVRTPTYVAWVPLAPRETYYGHGDYGPHSVNIVNVNVTNVVVKKVYKNVYVKNSVTTVDHDTFVRGHKHKRGRGEFKVKDNPFLKEKISVGRPDIKPERETRMAVIKDIPKAKEPPERVRKVKVKELKEQRRLVKKEDTSVFVGDKAPPAMTVEKKKTPRKKVTRQARGTEKEPTAVAPAKAGEGMPPPPEGKGATTEQPSASPEGERKPRPKPQPATEEREPGRDKGGRVERRTTRPTPAEEVRPAPVEREVAPVEEQPSTPPESKRKERPRPQPAMEERPPSRDESGRAERRTTRPPTPRQEVRPIPVEREVAPVEEQPSVPPESRRREKPRPQPTVEESPFGQGQDRGGGRAERRERQPSPQKEEIQPPPAQPLQEETLPADGGKKGKKKKQPSQTDPNEQEVIDPDNPEK